MKQVLVLSVLALLGGCATYYVVPAESVPAVVQAAQTAPVVLAPVAVQAAPVVMAPAVVYYTTPYYGVCCPYYSYYPYAGIPFNLNIGVGIRLGGHRR